MAALTAADNPIHLCANRTIRRAGRSQTAPGQ